MRGLTVVTAILLLAHSSKGNTAALSPGTGSSSFEKVAPSVAPKTPAALIVPIDAQLRDFRDGAIESAYNDTTSSDFKSATSFEAFKAFVEKNPILIKHKSLEVRTNSIQEQEANITVILDPSKDATPVNYLLIKENNQWKVWHMSVTPLYSNETRLLMRDTEAMKTPIIGQLKALQEANIPRAYQSYTSEAFKRSASLDAFRNFVKDYPILSKPVQLDFKDPVYNKGTTILEVHANTDTSTTILEFTMGIEDDEWKIWGEKVLKQLARMPATEYSPSEGSNVHITQTKQDEDGEPSSGQLEFSRIDIGGRSDVKTNRNNSTRVLKSNQGDIFVNLFIHHGVFGSKIELQMEHLESRTSIPPISTTLEQDGNMEVSFIFSPPVTGWPPGHYTLTAASSTGATRTMPFVVE